MIFSYVSASENEADSVLSFAGAEDLNLIWRVIPIYPCILLQPFLEASGLELRIVQLPPIYPMHCHPGSFLRQSVLLCSIYPTIMQPCDADGAGR